MADAAVDRRAEALRVLAVNGGNAKKTARQLGIARSTLRHWAGRSNAHGFTPSPNQRPEQRDRLARKWRGAAERATSIALEALQYIDPAKLNVNDVKSLLIAGAVATDKSLLLTGQATSRTESLQISLVDPRGLRDAARRALGLPVEAIDVRAAVQIPQRVSPAGDTQDPMAQDATPPS